MAATDQTYRPQRTLDIVFGVSCVLMLASIVWMFAQDYFREYKVEVRDFRDVEEAMALSDVMARMPDETRLEQIEAAEKEVAAATEERDALQEAAAKEGKDLNLKKIKAENKAQELKAEYDSKSSLYDKEVEKRNDADPDSSAYKTFKARADELAKEVKRYKDEMTAKQNEAEEINRKLENRRSEQREAAKRVDDAEKKLKALTDEFDRFVKLSHQKRWKGSDRFRAFPVIDAFQSPVKIDQITLTDLPIDYSFKYVTRFDRCTTCHLGIDRPTYTREALRELTKADVSEEYKKRLDALIRKLRDREKEVAAEAGKASGEEKKKLNAAVDLMANRRATLEDLRVRQIPQAELNETRINEYSVHPRLDLFVDAKSPHPKQQFGCTICHAGQGSATDFNLASHTPNDATEKRRWTHTLGWEPNHFWDFPMLPYRFVESSCIKCHYQITDMLPNGAQVEIRAGKPVETPGAKVTRGYELVRENGCFGCHEISGVNKGRLVGPDLRLEPSPPLDSLTAEERAKATADPLNLPGAMRKVGPSLRRIAEKTNEKWVRRWLEAPRGFRPDTKMPHFYNLSTNSPDVLRNHPNPDVQKQADFPDAEIHGIAYYLFRESKDYLENKETISRVLEGRKKELEQKQKDNTIADAEKKELEEITWRLQQAQKPIPLAKEIRAGDGRVVTLPGWLLKDDERKSHEKNGRMLFTEKGCLACHSHRGTALPEGDPLAVESKAHFGPNLSDLAAKILPEIGGAEEKWRWLLQWILNPNIHHPRTRMPITHLTEEQAAEVAAWLMSQPAGEWKVADPSEPKDEVLENLARVYLEKSMGRLEARAVLENKGLTGDQVTQIRLRGYDADELWLASSNEEDSWSSKLKWFVGRKAITQLGCYGCHDIPGYETAKPIGTPLNDWGKKDPERLAFEDVIAYVKSHHVVVAQRDDLKDPTKPSDEWRVEQGNGKGERRPYEKFFFDALEHHQRQGFLHQKLMEPRSYDYDRVRNWDERLRMPQFRFSRMTVPDDAPADDKARAEHAEAVAREEVMTFILGLVAEPIPAKYVNDPTGEKLQIAKGKQVIEKYNCIGCHQVRPGTYEFKLTPDILEKLEDSAYAPNKSDFAGDHREPFKDQNEWTGRLQMPTDRLTIHGVPAELGKDDVIRLTEAVRFLGQDKKTVFDVPASSRSIKLPAPEEGLLSHLGPYGGTLTELLVPYLARKEDLYKDSKNARASLPPPLFREGEKTQPAWLFQFLRDPFRIRPMTVLRMPKFNMSPDEAMTLVNYFAAVDKVGNQGGDLSYPYLEVPQRSDAFWIEKTAWYLERLKKEGLDQSRRDSLRPMVEWLFNERLNSLEANVPIAEQAVEAAKKDEAKETDAAKKALAAQKRKDAEDALTVLKKEVAQLKDKAAQDKIKDNLFQTQLRRWETDEAYATDAYRMLANYNNACLGCHSIGGLKAKNPDNQQGPPLDLSWQRLRPGWTQRWTANPERMISYPTPMPANLKNGDTPWPEFAGNTFEQVTALRDILMFYPKVQEMPTARFVRPASPGGTK
jgi:mono/diheme cytochrome c family protein